ncbi:unnamed protein product, partial [Urochloa humidicola]
GVVTDFQETVTAIIKASDFPISIIVIGVGGTNFKGMSWPSSMPFYCSICTWQSTHSS